MTDLNAAVRGFFEGYEKAITRSDMQSIAACYADVFMFGGPEGVQAVKKDDFLKVLPRRTEYFKSAGLISTTLHRIEASNLDSKYVLASAVWKMRFQHDGAAAVDSDNSATYILSTSDDGFEIVFQIDHQDLTKKAEEVRSKSTSVQSLSRAPRPPEKRDSR